MQVVFNNPVLYVVDYPAQDGIEVIDKRTGVGTFMRDAAAERFKRELHDFVQGDPDIDAFDDFIDHYAALLTQPAIYH